MFRTEEAMVRSLLLGLVMATGAALQGLPAVRAHTAMLVQAPPAPVVTVQPSPEQSPVVPPATQAPFRVTFQNPTPQARDALLRLKELVATDTKVSCGLTMVQVDPKLDPRIRRELPPPAGQTPNLLRQPDSKIRRITPTVCRE
jgi:hypothetical protein